MDQRSARKAVLIAGASALVAGAAAALPLRAARWLAASADMTGVLSREPAECLAIPDDAAARTSIEIGRAAFRTPLLLGGQAARAGLSCQSCHVNGHGNPDFEFPGLSGAPGTADVTSSLMSTSRGDATINPKPIPSLYDPPRLATRNPRSPALEDFIRGLIVGEFDGAEPSPTVLRGLADYVRALPASCTGDVAVTLSRQVEDIRSAAASAERAMASGDIATARVMLFAVRDMLGRIAERYASPELSREYGTVAALDREIAAILAEDSAVSMQERLLAWRSLLAGRLQPVVRAEQVSLYNPDNLAKGLRGR